jgi:predicted nuclease of predicted toxin-antitoxin system
MNWLVDAQLPRYLASILREQGDDAIHTLDLPDGNRSSDAAILAIAERESRIVVTKDSDFVISFRLTRRPERLLLIATGNISNRALTMLFLSALPSLHTAFAESQFIELHAGPGRDTALLVLHS